MILMSFKHKTVLNIMVELHLESSTESCKRNEFLGSMP